MWNKGYPRMIAGLGIATCYFDGAVATRDWIVPSSTTDGMCHDSGIPWGQPRPQSVAVIGVSTTVLATAGYANVAVMTQQSQMLEFHLGSNSCTTAGTAGAVCNTTVGFPNSLTFPDTLYRAGCSGVGVGSGVPVIGAVNTKATNQFLMQVIAVTLRGVIGDCGDCCEWYPLCLINRRKSERAFGREFTLKKAPLAKTHRPDSLYDNSTS